MGEPVRPTSEVVVRSAGADGFTRIVSFQPAYDFTDLEPKRFYGRHGAELHMVLVGPAGAVHFRLFTDWMLRDDPTREHCHPTPAGLFIHSPRPHLDWGAERASEEPREHCEYLGGECWDYCIGLTNSDPVFARLCAEGDPGVWAALADLYGQYFVGTGAGS